VAVTLNQVVIDFKHEICLSDVSLLEVCRLMGIIVGPGVRLLLLKEVRFAVSVGMLLHLLLPKALDLGLGDGKDVLGA
jgi:hypothetical protein